MLNKNKKVQRVNLNLECRKYCKTNDQVSSTNKMREKKGVNLKKEETWKTYQQNAMCRFSLDSYSSKSTIKSILNQSGNLNTKRVLDIKELLLIFLGKMILQ